MDETKIPKTVWKKTFTPMDDISSNNTTKSRLFIY